MLLNWRPKPSRSRGPSKQLSLKWNKTSSFRLIKEQLIIVLNSKSSSLIKDYISKSLKRNVNAVRRLKESRLKTSKLDKFMIPLQGTLDTLTLPIIWAEVRLVGSQRFMELKRLEAQCSSLKTNVNLTMMRTTKITLIKIRDSSAIDSRIVTTVRNRFLSNKSTPTWKTLLLPKLPVINLWVLLSNWVELMAQGSISTTSNSRTKVIPGRS